MPPGSKLSAKYQYKKKQEASKIAEIIFGKYFRSCQKARPFITLLLYKLLHFCHQCKHNNPNGKEVLLQSFHGVFFREDAGPSSSKWN